MKSTTKTPAGMKTVMTLIGAEESSNKLLQTELTANTDATTTAQAGTVNVDRNPKPQFLLPSLQQILEMYYLLSKKLISFYTPMTIYRLVRANYMGGRTPVEKNI